MFASRCMSVKTVPVQHAEVDYAELCAALQAKVMITISLLAFTHCSMVFSKIWIVYCSLTGDSITVVAGLYVAYLTTNDCTAFVYLIRANDTPCR